MRGPICTCAADGMVTFAELCAGTRLHVPAPVVVLDDGIVAITREIGNDGSILEGNTGRGIKAVEFPHRPRLRGHTEYLPILLGAKLPTDHYKKQH